ncbi:S41 family peptidase [Acrocarpospora catenulata]|uniref:S41 family peptidase n=1 Tax=Acrocarpospora catenulata TaxID=2836182 RepID=UPI001BDA30CC|nr:S41 family peptidase [Acrocarpospora catenulata]
MIRILSAALLVAALSVSAPAALPAAPPAGCAPATAPPPPSAPPTSVNTLRQAYHCLLDNYYSGPKLDSRDLLRHAFAAYTRDLLRRGADRPDLQLPPLTGDRDGDWAAFAPVLGTGDPAALRAAIDGMVTALQDNHARWMPPRQDPDGPPRGTGIAGLSALRGDGFDPAARPPMFITRVIPGSPAAKAGIRPGDIILKVNDTPAFTGDTANASILEAAAAATVRLTLQHPVTGKIRTIRLTEAPITIEPPQVTTKQLRGGVRLVQLPGFFPGAADQVLALLRNHPKALILDLRGNGGGSPREVTRLLSAFAHGKTTSYFCPFTGECRPNHTDDTVPLLDIPLVVLTDRACASACEDFTAAVKDLHLGTLIGTRTAGAISGPSEAYLLDDGSVLLLPKVRHLGPNREILDTIGIPVDHHVPTTARDLATGRDPAVERALTLL